MDGTHQGYVDYSAELGHGMSSICMQQSPIVANQQASLASMLSCPHAQTFARDGWAWGPCQHLMRLFGGSDGKSYRRHLTAASAVFDQTCPSSSKRLSRAWLPAQQCWHRNRPSGVSLLYGSPRTTSCSLCASHPAPPCCARAAVRPRGTSERDTAGLAPRP